MSKIKEILEKIKPKRKKLDELDDYEKEDEYDEVEKANFLQNKKILIPIVGGAVLIVIVSSLVISGSKRPQEVDQVGQIEDEYLESEYSEDLDAEIDEIVEDNFTEGEFAEEYEIAEFIDNNVMTYTLDGEVMLYNTSGSLVDSIDLKRLNIDRLHEYNERGYVDVEEASNPVFLLEAPVETEFNIHKKENNYLFFADIERDLLFEVGERDGQLRAYEIARDISVKDINNISMAGDEYYLTMNEGLAIISPGTGELVAMPKVALLMGLKPELLRKYENKPISFAEYLPSSSSLYFTIEDGMFKVDFSFLDVDIIDEDALLNKDISKAFEYISLGDEIIDLFKYNNEIFAINNFGFNSDNSVLMKMGSNENNELIVSKIMELKGIYSKEIGVHNQNLYVRQSEYIKEIDLASFKPKVAYRRVAGVPVMFHEGHMYSMTDGVLNVAPMNDRLNPIRSFDVKGDTFYKGPIIY